LFVAQAGLGGYGISRVAEGRQGGPAAIQGVVGAGSRGVGGEGAARL